MEIDKVVSHVENSVFYITLLSMLDKAGLGFGLELGKDLVRD